MTSFICHHCDHQFDRKYNVRRHIINNHLNNRKHKTRISCPYCQSHFCSFKSLDLHQQQMHSKQVELQEYLFKTEEEFYSWKENEQISSQAQFFVHQNYVTKKGERVKQYLCSRSGTYKSSRPFSERKRPQCLKGSRKIGSICPARMIATFSSDSINVKYYPNHRPHENNLCHLSLPKREEKLLADEIKKGVSLNKILDDIRNECVSSSNLQVKHFVKRKTLNNIRRKYNIRSGAKSSSNDDSAVTKLLDECSKNNQNPFIIFKKPKEPHDLLNIDDLFAVIMTEAQKEVLTERCSEQICIDTISNVNKYNYQLVTIEVIDEFGEVFPCAFCITSQITNFTMCLFFNLIKNETGRIKTNLFISDDDPCYYNAWETTMTPVPTRFLNKWYMDKNFRLNLRSLTYKRDKCYVYSYLRSLLEESDLSRFSSLLREFRETLKKKEYNAFMDYFLSTYAHRPENWAICYRGSAFLNVSLVLENFHKQLEQIFAQFVKTRRLDFMLYRILKIVRDKTFDRRIGLHEGHVNNYIENIQKRHLRAKRVKSIEKIDDTEWQVESTHTKGLKYQVKSEKSYKCDCQMKCATCNTCVHEFHCTCHDYLLSNYLCKHIHAVNIHDTAESAVDNHSEVKVTGQDIYETIPVSETTHELHPIDASFWEEFFKTNENYVHFDVSDTNAGQYCDIKLPVITDTQFVNYGLADLVTSISDQSQINREDGPA